MSNRTTVSLTKARKLWKTGATVEGVDETPDGHVLTVEHLGSNPETNVLGDYTRLLRKVLGEPDDFDEYTIDIGETETTVTRNDVSVGTFGTKQEMESAAASSMRPHQERQVFSAAADDMSATIADIATQVDASPSFVRETLDDI